MKAVWAILIHGAEIGVALAAEVFDEVAAAEAAGAADEHLFHVERTGLGLELRGGDILRGGGFLKRIIAPAEQLSGDTIRFATSHALDSHEGLTVAVGFAKGAIAPPSA